MANVVSLLRDRTADMGFSSLKHCWQFFALREWRRRTALLTLSSAKTLLDRYLCCTRLQKCRIWTGTTYATFCACRARAVLLARRGSLASMRPRSRGALRALRA